MVKLLDFAAGHLALYSHFYFVVTQKKRRRRIQQTKMVLVFYSEPIKFFAKKNDAALHSENRNII